MRDVNGGRGTISAVPGRGGMIFDLPGVETPGYYQASSGRVTFLHLVATGEPWWGCRNSSPHVFRIVVDPIFL